VFRRKSGVSSALLQRPVIIAHGPLEQAQPNFNLSERCQPVPDRYAGRPFLKLVDSYVLSLIGVADQMIG